MKSNAGFALQSNGLQCRDSFSEAFPSFRVNFDRILNCKKGGIET